MKETPILFIEPMVRAIRAGTKTQTRRVVNPQPYKILDGTPYAELRKPFRASALSIVRCPYGQPGDRLWVKETFRAWGRWETRYSAKKGRDEWHFIDMTLECGKQYRYVADAIGDNGPRERGSVTPQWWKRPAIFMPRAASRILLDITGERVERLQGISDDDALAEGVSPDMGLCWQSGDDTPRGMYGELWESINGPGSWDVNPWVWVVEFKRVTP